MTTSQSLPNGGESLPVAFYQARRAIRVAVELGYNETSSSRDIKVDATTAVLLAKDLDLPRDFVWQVFTGCPVKQAEAIASAAMPKTGFEKVDYLFNWATKQGQVIEPETKVAAYIYTRPVDGCGCIVRDGLTYRWCDEHYQENEDRQREMRRQREKLNAGKSYFSKDQILANVSSMEG